VIHNNIMLHNNTLLQDNMVLHNNNTLFCYTTRHCYTTTHCYTTHCYTTKHGYNPVQDHTGCHVRNTVHCQEQQLPVINPVQDDRGCHVINIIQGNISCNVRNTDHLSRDKTYCYMTYLKRPITAQHSISRTVDRGTISNVAQVGVASSFRHRFLV